MNLTNVLHAVLTEYDLPLAGIHGVAHWARVLENGLRLADETGANANVVSLFAVLHDSRRRNEDSDPQHGPKAARFARKLRGSAFDLDDDELQLLCHACQGHTYERTHPDKTIQTCWDADRLDLGRVGIVPHASRLCTDVAKRPDVIQWAHRRATSGDVPQFVLAEWGLEIAATSWGRIVP
jgi:uncharacterized protein